MDGRLWLLFTFFFALSVTRCSVSGLFLLLAVRHCFLLPFSSLPPASKVYPIKLKTTKKSKRQQNAYSPNAFSTTFSELTCSRNDTVCMHVCVCIKDGLE